MSHYLHLSSPLLYAGFVHIISKMEPCPNNFFMKLSRYNHNMFMTYLSIIMFIMITIGNYQTNKFANINNLLCKSYENNYFANNGASLFLWSKYLEYGDTFYLHLSNKPISMLQYTHHMSTAFLMYMNFYDYLSPHMFVFMGSNCFVHIWMYWYFAEPRGWLYKYRSYITSIQIFQHIICLCTILITYNMPNCQQNIHGNFFGLLAYSMYLFYFVTFYAEKYISK